MNNNGVYGIPKSGYHEIYVTGGNGYGSASTLIRRYTNTVKLLGQAITYKDDAIVGGSFTINQTGIYAITMSDDLTTTGAFGISVNTTQPATGISSLTNTSERLSYSNIGAGSFAAGPSTILTILNTGDVVRGHGDQVSGVTAAVDVYLRITKIA